MRQFAARQFVAPPSGSDGAGYGVRVNPRPAVRPGDAMSSGVHQPNQAGFNPRPAVRPGDAPALTFAGTITTVSIRARP